MKAFITEHQVGHLVGVGLVVQVSHGAYTATAGAETLRSRAEALCRVMPARAVVCRRTAAWMWGLDVLPPGVVEAQWPVEILVPAGTAPTRRAGCVAYQADLPSQDVVNVAGVRVTSMERTALECARTYRAWRRSRRLTSFLRRGVDPAGLQRRATALSGRRNVARLRAVLDVADPGAESPGESWTRVLIVDAGLPRPVTQVPVRLPTGRMAYLDIGLEEYRTGIEYDGEDHHSGREAERHDVERRGQLAVVGWRTVAARKQQVLGDRRPFLEHVVEILLCRGWNPSAERLDEVMRRIAFLSSYKSYSLSPYKFCL